MSEVAHIIGFGSVAIDELVCVDAPMSSGKGRVIKEWQAHGGNVATALCTASQLGANTGFVGCLSDDPRDVSVLEAFRAAGVDLSLVSYAADARPIRSTVIVDSLGDRFIAFRDDTRMVASSKLLSADLGSANILLIDSYAAYSPDTLSKALSSSLTIIADVEWSIGSETEYLLSRCHHLVLPIDFAASITGQSEPEDIIDALWSAHQEAIVITGGADGAWVRQGAVSDIWHQRIFKADVVDTTGCGDCFHGAYATALNEGMDPCQSVRFAAAAAALSSEGLGGRGVKLTRALVDRMLNASGSPEPERLAC